MSIIKINHAIFKIITKNTHSVFYTIFLYVGYIIYQIFSIAKVNSKLLKSMRQVYCALHMKTTFYTTFQTFVVSKNFIFFNHVGLTNMEHVSM